MFVELNMKGLSGASIIRMCPALLMKKLHLGQQPRQPRYVHCTLTQALSSLQGSEHQEQWYFPFAGTSWLTYRWLWSEGAMLEGESCLCFGLLRLLVCVAR